ncbi:CinA family protein [Streptomyces alkaliterrae]|uniref:CinA family protein n=1 Tax=Streptomyces alkaliterrae TaxID=2213162 RepID=A0A5P0YKC6_9ACTN|nr:CinA family protein [Streptomyces alkaliterrae]MBB1252576.1 CinA family protein [Streptomyces alkaliterrae]MBB1258580.1 CinA family protein [Streptomyces alkaliterrae]MQS00824.1 nicotinamide-nucleotide amidohydrolase family protein [Streptomyces alkaliterrae]
MADEAAEQTVELLTARGQTVAAAESLTGGLVAVELTDAPGSSRAFRGSITAYATDLKARMLGVDQALLDDRGAVDAEVARQMAAGVREALDTDWGVATTGVAGPDRQDGQPVGTVFVAVAGPHGQPPVAERLSLDGDRAEIRRQTVRAVLELLYGELVENAGRSIRNTVGGLDVYSPE